MYSHFSFSHSSDRKNMVERLFLPNRARGAKQFVNPVSSGALEALQNIHDWKRPAILIAKWLHQHVRMVSHHHDGMQVDARCRCGAGALAREWANSSLL